MRTITFSIWLLWLILLETNAELTLESINRRVTSLETEIADLKADNKHLMNLNRGQPKETNGQSILTPEFASLLSSFNEVAIKNLEMLKLGQDSGNELGMDRFGREFRSQFEQTVFG